MIFTYTCQRCGALMRSGQSAWRVSYRTPVVYVSLDATVERDTQVANELWCDACGTKP